MSKVVSTQNLALYDSCPIGAIIAFPAAAIPNGWLECNGQAVSRATYAELFVLIGTAYGAGDGSTFSLPDYRGVFLRGKDNGKGYDAGRALGSLQADDVGPHTHLLSTTQSTASGGSGYVCPYPNQSTTQAGDVLANTGTETRPKNVSVVYCIKAAMSIITGLTTISTYSPLTHTTHQGEVVSFGTNGYKKFADGLIIQWGAILTSVSSVTFPVAFPTALASVAISWKDCTPASVYSEYLGCTASTKSGMTVLSANTVVRCYVVIGY